MTFREKSAWVMAVLMIVTGLVYGWLVMTLSAALGQTAPPLAAAVPYVLLVVVGSVVLQTVLSLLTPKEAQAPADEREQAVMDRAGSWAGLVTGAGVVCALGWFLVQEDGRMLFHMVLGALIVGQVATHLFEIVLFRRGSH